MWLMGLVAPRHVGSSQTRARTRVPRIGRQTLNHCATREALIGRFSESCLGSLGGDGMDHNYPTCVHENVFISWLFA